ncbi:MAG: hypothetical protein DI617_03515 [Streptococcus pyogenes]|nr:MAG: hypothetical protein DI617_03515 [Streptococcus pyogenes]
MDIAKLKEFAIKAAGKAKDGVTKANELRKKASQESKIKIGNAIVRKTVDSQYYFGFYSETPYLFEFVGFDFAGSIITQKTVTKGKTKQQGRTGSVLGGAVIGNTIAPGVGAIVGGMAGGSRKKKGTIDSTSVTTTEEKPGKAVVKFRAVNGDEVKTIKTKLTQAEANNVQMFFLG